MEDMLEGLKYILKYFNNLLKTKIFILLGKTSPRVVALKSWAQLMGGCCVFRFVQLFWWFEIISTHEGRSSQECTADLQVTKVNLNLNWIYNNYFL